MFMETQIIEFLGKLRYNNLEGSAGEDYRFRGGR
jgi:hypothetical protein